MWSAPKQPFVLPVRIRNFEEKYGKNVNNNTESFERAAAIEIRKRSEERDEELAQALLQKMKSEGLSTHDEGESWRGIYYGQLFYFFQQIKDEDRFRGETRSEEQLYEPVLEKLFGHPVDIKKGQHRTKGLQDYYGVPMRVWKEKLG